MVLIDNMENNTTTLLRFSFRPLAGIMVLIVLILLWKCQKGSLVSVPLRGLWFLSRSSTVGSGRRTERVSVPLRGLWFLSLNNIKVDGDYSIEFPSPCGDYGSYQAEKQGEEKSFAESFRPLAGIMVLITGL